MLLQAYFRRRQAFCEDTSAAVMMEYALVAVLSFVTRECSAGFVVKQMFFFVKTTQSCSHTG